jgi:hypothetical protein
MLSKETRNSVFITDDDTKFVQTVEEYDRYVVILRTTKKQVSSLYNNRNVAAGLILQNYATVSVLAVHSYIAIVA